MCFKSTCCDCSVICVHIARILMPRSLTFLSFKDWRLLETNTSESARIESPASRNGVPSGNAASRPIRSNSEAVQIQVLGELRDFRVRSFLQRQILEKFTLSHDVFMKKMKNAKMKKDAKDAQHSCFPLFCGLHWSTSQGKHSTFNGTIQNERLKT